MDVSPHSHFLHPRNVSYFSFFSEIRHSEPIGRTVVETLAISAVLLVSVAANMGAVVMVVRERRLMSNKTVLTLNLFVADLLFVSMIPLIVAARWTVSWRLGYTTCHIVLYVICVSGCVTISTLASISVERLQAILRLQTVPTLNTWMLSAVLTFIWAFSALASIPLILFFTVMEEEFPKHGDFHICTLKWPDVTAEIVWNVSFTALCFLLPGLIIVGSYSKILQVARTMTCILGSLWEQKSCRTLAFTLLVLEMGAVTKRSRQRIWSRVNPSSPGESRVYSVSRQDIKLLRTLMVLMLSFLIMWSPIFIITFLILARNFLGQLDVSSSLFFWVVTFTMTNSALNPILYSVFQFKNAWRRLCCGSVVAPVM